MDSATKAIQSTRGGFNFDLVKRNALLEKNGVTLPNFIKTGTTIAGVVFKDGVVLGADTRSTGGQIVSDKNCEKIHRISDNIYCCGAGVAADTAAVTGMIESQLELHRLNTGTQPRVCAAAKRLGSHLFRYQGYVVAALVLGGVDCTGAYLHTVHPHGSTAQMPYVTMGSGSLAAMAVFEDGYADDMEEKDAVNLVDRAIQSGIFNDEGSGGNVDICVITRDETRMLRTYRAIEHAKYAAKPIVFPHGSTAVISEKRELFKTLIVEDAGGSMDTS